MNNKDNFKPYIMDENVQKELTLTSIVTGIILAVVFGAANAYLGLRVGMTVSASIPAAVISMGIIRIALRRNSILESNIVQTIGSAGESLAAGAIFTVPALFLWAGEGKIEKPDIITITLIALIGGLFGVFFMIPLRNALVVKEHGVLPYPEGKACAEVLLAGEKTGSGALAVFTGMGFAAAVKLITDGFKMVSGEVSLRFKGFAGEIGTQIYPAILSVGYICGPRISAYMFGGGVLSWLALIPLIVLLGQNTVLYPADVTIGEIFATEGASGIWSTYIRYIGAGALASGGIISLVKSLPLILSTFGGVIRGISSKTEISETRTSRGINMGAVIAVIAILTVLVWIIPDIPVSPLGALLVVVFGFFFASVSSRMVGIVGSSSNPVSGMSIATVLMTTVILKAVGYTGIYGMTAAIAIGSIICIISAIAGDTSQDLKTGYILGATPRKQQIGEVIGVVSSSLAIGVTLYLLDTAWGFGSRELGAPQATLMKLITEGVMNATLPWTLVLVGVFISIFVELTGVPVLPVAIGIYLPVHLNACIMVGGVIRYFADKFGSRRSVNRGILFSSGMIAGEGIVGILLAILAVLGIDSVIDISARFNIPAYVSDALGLTVFAIVAAVLARNCIWKGKYEK